MNMGIRSWSPLHVSVVKTLLAAGADVSVRGINNFSALGIAAKGGMWAHYRSHRRTWDKRECS